MAVSISHTDGVAVRRAGRPRRSLGLRPRVTLAFSIAGLVSSLALATVTYVVARGYLLDQREKVAKSQAFVNAQSVQDALIERRSEPDTVVRTVRTEGGGFAILHVNEGDQYFSQDPLGFNQDSLPAELRRTVLGGRTGFQRYTFDGRPYVAVGVSVADSGVQYFELFPLSSVENNLRAIGTALLIGAATTTLFAAGLGWWATRVLLRPLSRVADAATEIASGGLDTRLPAENDRDLDRLASSFNEMADAVQARIQREARFSSDVSHELRSPITALTAAVEVLDARRADLPERSQQALDVVVSQVRRFDQMVLDLLELSRLDAGATDVHIEEVVLPDLVRRISQRYGFNGVPIDVGTGANHPIVVDKRRVERIVANLLDNARQHGGGPVRISLEPANVDGEQRMNLVVEDAGPGVALSERTRIFERFARGTASRHRVGTGLGLALVSEHAQSHGGDAWVEDRPGGGSRFVVSLPDSGAR